jgi:hypothetical protein
MHIVVIVNRYVSQVELDRTVDGKRVDWHVSQVEFDRSVYRQRIDRSVPPSAQEQHVRTVDRRCVDWRCVHWRCVHPSSLSVVR